jgi:hypothetical protein
MTPRRTWFTRDGLGEYLSDHSCMRTSYQAFTIPLADCYLAALVFFEDGVIVDRWEYLKGKPTSHEALVAPLRQAEESFGDVLDLDVVSYDFAATNFTEN